MKFTSAIFFSAVALFHAACAAPAIETDALLSRRVRPGGVYISSGDVVKRTDGIYLLSDDVVKRTDGIYLLSDDVVKRTGGDVDALDKRAGGELYIITDDVMKRDGGAVA
ncbi:uncharacterized protein B0H18DRAFT_1214671 [Fomitopsis serialis]|uniref:uncharacterized protein n=1 Tax=Fomitopsis serialis TaxID=139415 RepID=UPI002007F5C4|nr:uncharacterized protein B0H18DRAFT_1214671 [Neoantrodia serialis]KAH9917339.1 hypothetical protein B0H18DRAFT_1214671 [Neoantrodia serialis]